MKRMDDERWILRYTAEPWRWDRDMTISSLLTVGCLVTLAVLVAIFG